MTISPPSTVTISPAKQHGSPAIPDLKQKLLHLQNTLTKTRVPASQLVDTLNSLPTTATLERAKAVSGLKGLRRKYDTYHEHYLRSWRPAADPSTTPLVNTINAQFNRLIAKGAHERPPEKLSWRELHNFAGNQFPKASSEALES